MPVGHIEQRDTEQKNTKWWQALDFQKRDTEQNQFIENKLEFFQNKLKINAKLCKNPSFQKKMAMK